jgi:hypothetical protein
MLHPVRNDAPLLCNEVRAQNNSGGVRCPARLRVATTGISNGVHGAALLKSLSKAGSGAARWVKP